MLDALNGVGDVLLNLPPGRLLFGSHAPLFYFESAALKLQESPLTDAQLRAVRFESARRLLPGLPPDRPITPAADGGVRSSPHLRGIMIRSGVTYPPGTSSGPWPTSP